MYFPKIHDLRIDNDKTQDEIAKYLNCHVDVYRRYEKGYREIPLWAAIKLADYYNCSLDYLCNRTDIKTPYGQHKK